MECLPYHILVKIFSNLDTKSLVISSKVCQLWSELIKSSQDTMNCFNIKITSNRSRQTITILDELPCGRHRNLQIIDFCGDFIILKQLLSIHRMTLANIIIVRPTLWQASIFTEAFSALRNLSELTLENCHLGECEKINKNVSGEIENFAKLRELRIINCNCEIFNLFIGVKNLSSLHVEYSYTFNPPENITMKYLINLLRNSPNLDKLLLFGVTSFRENPFSDCFKFGFKLERMKIDVVEREYVSLKNVKKFLKDQKKSLKYLIFLTKPSDEIVEFIKSELTLNKLVF
ncbi:hypothetical protein PVAND_003497 [Polypedilum vanderplanki]|uniref:F-box domain-containing protein n=1 Tax=Polypedilum vanderplanki TaxID=319348 RepID=A0A9J6BV99_POLVA|nr:hypothetical protein PVAND_003497 [Polypedilum vanderplanki]